MITQGTWRAVDLRYQKNGQIRIFGLYHGHLANVLRSNAHAEDDARLIAAAPELLAALKKVLIWLQCDIHCDTADAEEFVRNAIKKAEGRE